jgi:hypothetical protein
MIAMTTNSSIKVNAPCRTKPSPVRHGLWVVARDSSLSEYGFI